MFRRTKNRARPGLQVTYRIVTTNATPLLISAVLLLTHDEIEAQVSRGRRKDGMIWIYAANGTTGFPARSIISVEIREPLANERTA